MALSDFLTPKMIILGSTLISLIAMTPVCGGETYNFYEDRAKAGVNDKEASAALETMMAAYRKDTPEYAIKEKPLYAATENKSEFLLLMHPYFGTCAPSCVPALIKRTTDGGAVYVKDVEGLNCRLLYKKDALILCDHSKGFF